MRFLPTAARLWNREPLKLFHGSSWIYWIYYLDTWYSWLEDGVVVWFHLLSTFVWTRRIGRSLNVHLQCFRSSLDYIDLPSDSQQPIGLQLHTKGKVTIAFLSHHQNHENAIFLLTWTVPPAARSDFLFAAVDACRCGFFPEAVGRQPGCQSPVHGITPVTSSRFSTLPSGQSLPSLLPIRFGWFRHGHDHRYHVLHHRTHGANKLGWCHHLASQYSSWKPLACVPSLHGSQYAARLADWQIISSIKGYIYVYIHIFWIYNVYLYIYMCVCMSICKYLYIYIYMYIYISLHSLDCGCWPLWHAESVLAGWVI